MITAIRVMRRETFIGQHVRKAFVFLCFACLSLSLLSTPTSQAASDIQSIRLSTKNAGTRIVFDMSKAADHKLFQLDNPKRLVVDIEEATLRTSTDAVDLGGSPIATIRAAKRQENSLRVVFDLNKAVKAKSFLLPKNEQNISRLVIDLDHQVSAVAAKVEEPVESIENRVKIKRDLIIAIDAGHGGEDPGAIGVNKMHEKKVVYQISTRVANLFNERKGYKAVMVREGDYFIPLAKRREIAKAKNADMFISIHADSFTHKKAQGASVYTLSSQGATSTSAKFLAERENNADLIGGVRLDDKDDVLSSVLVDLSMTYKMESSVEVAEQVLKQLGKVTKLHGNRIEKAGFAVLKTLDIPSILIETGFMSNPKEARNLSSSKFQQKLSNAIFTGVDAYFREKAPEDTYIAATFRHNRAVIYVVERGDTLSQIALRYNVPITNLMDFNSLTDKSLAIGQTLQIPVNP